MIKLTTEEKAIGLMVLLSYIFLVTTVYFDRNNEITYKNIWFSMLISIITILVFTLNVYLCRKVDR